MVEGIVECMYLSPLWWKRGDIDRNKTHLTQAICLVLPVDLFSSLNSIWINAFTSDTDSRGEKMKGAKFSKNIYLFTWRLNLILESGFPSLFHLSWSSTQYLGPTQILLTTWYGFHLIECYFFWQWMVSHSLLHCTGYHC